MTTTVTNFTDTANGWQRAFLHSWRERATLWFPADSGRLLADAAGLLRTFQQTAG